MKTSFTISLLTFATAQGKRVISFENLCAEPIWFGFAGGST
jgi:hypothetical protein